MSSMSLDDGNAAAEKVLCQQMVKDDCLDSTDLLFFLLMGCTAWLVWKIFIAIVKFLKWPERSTNCTVEQKITNNSAPMGTLSNSQKEWHKEMGSGQREHFVQMLVNVIFAPVNVSDRISTHQSDIIEDRLRKNFEFYFRKVESDAYNVAKSKAEYSMMLDKGFCEITEELSEAWRKREKQKLQKNQLQQQPPPQMSQSEEISGKTPQTTSSGM